MGQGVTNFRTQVIKVSLLAWAVGSASLATAAATPSSQPSEQLQGHVPEAWVLGVNRNVGELSIHEYFPPDTEQHWQQKVVYESLTTDQLPDALHYADGLVEQQEKGCEDFSENKIFSGYENQYPTVVQLIVCGKNNVTGKPLVTLAKVIQGNQSLYSITRIWRLEKAADDQEIFDLLPRGEFGAWSQTLKKVQLCDPSLSAHPCEDE